MTDCNTAEYSPIRADGRMQFNYRAMYWFWFMQYGNAPGNYYQCNQGTADGWTCLADMDGFSEGRPLSEVRIFDTDYDNYALKYSCSLQWWTFNLMKSERLTVDTREQTMSDAVYEKVNAVVKEKLPEFGDVKGWFNDLHWTMQGDLCNYEWKF